MSNKQQLLRVTVTPVRNRKPKTPSHKSSARAYADKLLDLLHDPNIVHLDDPDIFVSLVAKAVQDLNKVE